MAKDQRGFVRADTGEPFVVWGFNYDHDAQGRLIEDYWEDEWDKMVEDFGEMKALGANVVRVHLQFGKFMRSATQPDPEALGQLGRLLELAEQLELYLDLTGLGCYHRQDVPPWYDQLSEEARWDAQARFWEAVAARCRGSSAVFCYDLMNEPVVPGGAGKRDDWLGPALGDKHFVQFIALETRGRRRSDVARQWVERLVGAIRQHDRDTLITVGLVPWSLDRPGLTSGFVPAETTESLDFVAVHIYPEQGKVDEALEVLRGFDVGKPVVVEELFPLRCSVDELRTFIDSSSGIAAGWIGFYWGEQPEGGERAGSIAEALTAGWIELFKEMAHDR